MICENTIIASKVTKNLPIKTVEIPLTHLNRNYVFCPSQHIHTLFNIFKNLK